MERNASLAFVDVWSKNRAKTFTVATTEIRASLILFSLDNHKKGKFQI